MQTNLQHLRIEYLPIERLKPNPRNPRKHPRRQIRALRSSLKKYGFVTPVLIDVNDSTMRAMVELRPLSSKASRLFLRSVSTISLRRKSANL
jgi:ParB-like nuclease domain